MKSIMFATLMMGVVLFWGCGNSTNKSITNKSEEMRVEVTKEAKAVQPSSVSVTLLSDDQMRFDKSEIRVPAGSKVELTLKHTGKLDKKIMGHNFVLLKPGIEIMAYGAEAGVAGLEKDYIAVGDDAIVHTKLLGGGESTTITFDAPAKGSYDFICSFPGHYAMMKGKFIVE